MRDSFDQFIFEHDAQDKAQTDVANELKKMLSLRFKPNAPEEGDIVLPSTAAKANIGMWVHNNNNILLNNRTSHMEPEAPEDSELTPEDLLKIIEAKDPYEKRLKQIDDDNKVIV